MSAAEKVHDRRVYRVRGQRSNGTWKYKDFFSRKEAAERAKFWSRSHLTERDGYKVREDPLVEITIIRSAPIRWIFDEEEAP